MYKRLKILAGQLVLLAYPLLAHGQTWSTQFGAPPGGQGLNSSANALLEYQGKLIVAGSFTQAGPIAVNRIVAWDGTQWSALGDGLPDAIEDLVEYEGYLVAAGGWTPAMLMRWDGSTWSAIPSQPANPFVFHTVCTYNGSLYVNSYESGVSKLAWWDGVSWSSVPVPLDVEHTDADVYAMAAYQGQLFITGVGPWDYGGFLFSWDGEAFGGPGWVFPSYGYSLHEYHELLYVGGDWAPAPPFADHGVAIWDGGQWIPFRTTPIGTFVPFAFDMETYHGRIAMGGSGVTSFSGIAYNGQNEQFLGGGCLYTMWVNDVEEFQGDLYVAGVFDEICTESGRIESYNIAKWSEPVTAVSTQPKVADKLRVDTAPNPFNPSVTLTIQVPSRSDVVITICDATGRVVRHLATGVQNRGPHRVTWNGVGDNGEKLASGVYFARVAAGAETATAKLVLLK